MSAELIARALGGRRTGSAWMTRCPVHDDRTPSLAVREGRDGRVLLHCHAGCRQDDVLAALAARGLSVGTARSVTPVSMNKKFYNKTDDQHADKDDRSGLALALWRQTSPAAATTVETYLNNRGIIVAVPDRLRFHPRLKHPDGGVWPGMVALVTRGTDDVSVAVHRTFLAGDGRGKAPVEPQKMMLGPCRGGAVRLGGVGAGDDGDRDDGHHGEGGRGGGDLLVGEGIESCLSVLQATGRRTWAALSTSGLLGLDLPADIIDVTILADADPAGERAARTTASRWLREGRRVRIARPPVGKDFNDVLLVGASSTIPGAAP